MGSLCGTCTARCFAQRDWTLARVVTGCSKSGISSLVAGFENTLGAAQYRAGEWHAAVESLKKSMELRSGGDAFDWYLLAMAHWQLGELDEARKWYKQAVEWVDKNSLALSGNPQLADEFRRFRTEAEGLIAEEKP